MNAVAVTCPHCWQAFTVPGPAPTEVPVEWDYDCETCCRPMLIAFDRSADGETIEAEARSLDEP